jgi:hypothetical protein
VRPPPLPGHFTNGCQGLDSQHLEAVRFCGESQRFVVSGHDQISAERVPPQEGGSEMNRVEGAEFCGHGLGGAIEYDAINFVVSQIGRMLTEKIGARAC